MLKVYASGGGGAGRARATAIRTAATGRTASGIARVAGRVRNIFAGAGRGR